MDKLFLDYQGYKVKETIIYKNNKSETIFDNNGKKSSSKRKKHINTRILKIANLIKQNWTKSQLISY